MKHTIWLRTACLAVLLGSSVCAYSMAAQADQTEAVLAGAADFSSSAGTERVRVTETEEGWLVSDNALEAYGIKSADKKKGTYYFRLPEGTAGTGVSGGEVALRLPGKTSKDGRMINIQHMQHALGIRCERIGETIVLLPPDKTAASPLQLPQFPAEPARGPQKEHRIRTVLVWDPVMDKKQTLVPVNTAQAVMSPCAFRLTRDGIELRRADLDVLAALYEQENYGMWPLVDNNFDPSLTHEILEKPAWQDRIARELAGYALLYGFRGYNLDFENIRYADRDKLTAFVKKISDVVHAYGVQLSMDVTPLSDSPNWSLVYDRQKLEPSLDYMAVMAYDQFGRTSPVAGPVASYPWVEKAVQRMAEIVPPEKILLGMPLYMRIWYESFDQQDLPAATEDWPAVNEKAWKTEQLSGEEKASEVPVNTAVLPGQSVYYPIAPSVRPVALGEGLSVLPAAAPERVMSQTAADRTPKLFVRTLTWADSEAIRQKYGRYICWDDTLRLWYLNVPLLTGRLKIWFEDEQSLQEKMKLIDTYKLGGASFWRKGFEPDGFWQGFMKHELT